MPLEWLISWRYFNSKRKHPFIGMISAISVLGVAIGVAALIVVLSVMGGFDRDLKERIVGTYAHMVIEGEKAFVPSQELTATIQSVPDVTASGAFIQTQALLSRKDFFEGVLVRGADFNDEKAISSIGDYILKGKYPGDHEDGILIGSVLADKYRLEVGSTLELITAETKKAVPMPVTGVFSSGMYEYDAHLVYLSLANAQTLFRLPGKVTGIAVKFREPDLALKHRVEMQVKLGFPFFVRTWSDMNQTLFGALRLEKTVMFLILTLIVIVACFNIIGTLTLLVMDKAKDIGILKTLGATPAQIQRLFILSGFYIGILGTSLGGTLGWALCVLIERFQFIDIPSEIYYFNDLPVAFSWQDFTLIISSALLLSLLSTLYPAWIGSKLKPVEALKV